ncbi:protein TILLER ANGLE CONTROL 1 [Gossypium raimondii]|uniref:Protein TILLER ANGLE CONTROL 1 n=2 Tax=Gossypium raimondii TaxID=29730 RepID=A0A0D2SBF6_GOSRA|nr:protein TILLER ANGLE CONTROL 1 [Gossypium raimondii]KJB41599.1 hypothetical protein B456_007G111200 [Gossypium raimondii]
MKIFNWVQRRFHHNVLKDGLARNVKKTDSIAIDSNTKALVEQVALVDMLDGWRDGVLTIGTFGFDPLKSLAEEQNDYLASGSYEDDDEERYSDNNDDEDVDGDDDDEEEEVNPLMLSSFEPSLEDVDSNVDNSKYRKKEVMMMVDGSTDHEIKFNLDATEDHSGKLRRRTTLADLFSEDTDIKKKPSSPLHLDTDSCKKPSSLPAKNGLSFAKKLIPQVGVGEDSRPIKMLHQMMRRMLKRKIHPELEGKGNQLEGRCKASVIDAVASSTLQANESVSLLQSPDIAEV